MYQRRLGKNRGVKNISLEQGISKNRVKTSNEIIANSIKSKMISLFGATTEEAEYFQAKVVNFRSLTTLNVNIFAALLAMILRNSSNKKRLPENFFNHVNLDPYISKITKLQSDNPTIRIKAYATIYIYYRYWIKNIS